MPTSGIDVHEHTLVVRKEIVTIYNITGRRGAGEGAESGNLHVPKRGTRRLMTGEKLTPRRTTIYDRTLYTPSVRSVEFNSRNSSLQV